MVGVKYLKEANVADLEDLPRVMFEEKLGKIERIEKPHLSVNELTESESYKSEEKGDKKHKSHMVARRLFMVKGVLQPGPEEVKVIKNENKGRHKLGFSSLKRDKSKRINEMKPQMKL